MADPALAKLEQAYRDLDYLQPLKPDDGRLARELIEGFLDSLARELVLLKGQGRKLLLHGHVGCGKSTLLNCLEVHKELRKHFLLAPLFIKDVTDPDDVDAIDVMFGAITAALDRALAERIRLKPDAVQGAVELYKELKGLLKIEVTREKGRKGAAKAEAGLSVPSILNWLLAGFQANYSVSFETRKKVRETFAPKLGQLVERVNATLTAIEARLGSDRRILFLVHDTDKPRIDRALRLLEDQGYQLAQLDGMAVFVIDKAVACSGRFAAITTRLGAARPFPAFKLVEPTGAASDATRANAQLLTGLLTRRLLVECTEDGALARIVELGGGHFREMLRIAREAVLKALLRGSPRVFLTDVDYAGIQRANEFNPTQQQWRILREVLENPDWCPPDAQGAYDSPESPVLQLLNGVALLEYSNAEDKWLRPHPALIERIKRRKL
jgi:energy-coupling factor transporter ATP-binding protein EcfA2